jgi:hypothetical protein
MPIMHREHPDVRRALPYVEVIVNSGKRSSDSPNRPS